MIIASIDIGTNTILLLIADVDKRSKKFKTILNEHCIPRIGKGLKPGGKISEENIKKMLEVLKEYSSIIEAYNCDHVIASATNALRIASNSDEIIKTAMEKFNIEIKIIPGEEEALYSYLGVSDYLNDLETGLVIDIGGGSTEIIIGKKTDIIFKKSFSVGVVSGTEDYLFDNPPLKKEINNFYEYLENIFAEINKPFSVDKSIAIAGTPTTLACLKLNLKEYDEDKIEGSFLTFADLEKLIDELSDLSDKEITNKYKSVVKGREDVLLAGTIILHYLCRILKLDKIIVSTKGIRYGTIVNYIENYG